MDSTKKPPQPPERVCQCEVYQTCDICRGTNRDASTWPERVEPALPQNDYAKRLLIPKATEPGAPAPAQGEPFVARHDCADYLENGECVMCIRAGKAEAAPAAEPCPTCDGCVPGCPACAERLATAELPPRPTLADNAQPATLTRYGVRWPESGDGPILQPSSSGYWTPWHIAEAELAQARAEAEQLRAKLQNLAAEYYFLTHREYDDNAARAFDNRRKLARIIAANWLHLNEADTKAMVEAAVEHGGTGGELLNWYLDRLRSEAEQLRRAMDCGRDDGMQCPYVPGCVKHMGEGISRLRAEIEQLRRDRLTLEQISNLAHRICKDLVGVEYPSAQEVIVRKLLEEKLR